MSEENTGRSTGRVFLELALLAGLGGWFCVSSLMALLGHAPGEKLLAQETALAIGMLGTWPTFLASLAVAAIGAWSFLSTRPVPAFRHAAGALLVGLGLALALGPFQGSDGALGGEVGGVLPSLVAGRLGVALAVALGLAVILATAWLFWLPEGKGFSSKPGEQRQVPAAGDPEAGGVTPAEAEALVAAVPRPAAIPSAYQPTPTPAADVRIQGGVPAGARPLTQLHERPSPQDHDPDPTGAGLPAPAGGAADQLARADLASAGAATAGRADAGQPLAPEAGAPASSGALTSGVRPLADTPLHVPDRPIWESTRDEPSGGLFVEPEPRREEPAWNDPADLPSPSWEDPADAFEPPFDDVLVLDADDAPAEAPDVRGATEPAADVPRPAGPPVPAATAQEELAPPASAVDPAGEDLALASSGDALEQVAAEEGLAAAPGVAADEEDRVDDEDDEEEEDEEEEDEEEEDEEEEEEDELEEEEEDADETVTVVERPRGPLPGRPADEETLAPSAGGEGRESGPAGEPEGSPRPRARHRSKPEATTLQSGLFDGEEPETGDDLPSDEFPAVEVPAQPASGLTAAVSAAADVEGPEELILRAGLLFLEENRVAVSMLQRRFGLDFDQATTVLDALQQRGLIGPYLGGKTRDILMTREEWMAHAHGV